MKKLKFYYIKDLQGNVLVSDLSDDTKKALKKVSEKYNLIKFFKISRTSLICYSKAVDFLGKSFNTEVKELKLGKLKSSVQIWASMMRNGKWKSNDFSCLLTDTSKPINPCVEIFKTFVGLQKHHTLPAIGLSLTEQLPTSNPPYYIELGKQLKREIADILGDDGVLLFPSFPISAPYHNQPLLTNTVDFIHYGIINSLGLPATQCPMGLSDHSGLPTGVQVIANTDNDHLCIGVAEYMEANLVGWVPGFDTTA